MFGRRKVAMLVAEFLGTAVLTLLILSVQRSTIGVPFFVAIAAGVTYAMLTFALASTSGAILNPALTIAMWTARKITTVNAVLFIAVQMLGGWAAYFLYGYFVNQDLQSVGGHFTARILVAEAVGAGLLSFGVASAYYQRFTAATSAAVSGLSYLVGIVAASSAAIGLLNPAVALGANAFVWGTYVLGPVVGAIIGFNLYALLFAPADDSVIVESAVAPAAASTVATTATTATRPKATVKPAAKPAAATKNAAAKTTAAKKKPAAKRPVSKKK